MPNKSTHSSDRGDERSRREPQRSVGLVGKRLGDFWILRELCEGQTGVVYYAEQVSVPRRVALKVLPVRLTLSPEYVHRFRREGEKLASLDHPGIVRVFEAGCESGTAFLAMEFVEGHCLQDELDNLRRPRELVETRYVLPPRRDPDYFLRVADVVADVAAAVHYAHVRGVVHRDIDPQNVMIEPPAGRPRVVGFGLAKDLADPYQLPGRRPEISPYSSPEQALERRTEIDHRTDVFSLGSLLYEMLTLRRPFEGTGDELRQAVALDDPIPASELAHDVPADLETLCRIALSKEPALRFADAGAMADELRRFARGQKIEARVATRIDRTAIWMRAHRIAVLVALVLMAAALMAVLVFSG